MHVSITCVMLIFVFGVNYASVYRRPSNCSNNVHMVAGILEKLDVPNQDTCQAACDNNANCKGYNYEVRKTRKCQLNSASAGVTGSNLRHTAHFSYNEKVTDGTDDTTDACKKYMACREIDHVDNHEFLVHRGDTYGYWGKDFLWENDYYYDMTHYDQRNTLYEFPNEAAFIANQYTQTYTLPYTCDGAQHIVYGGKFYCARHNERNIFVYDLSSKSQVATIGLDGVGGHSASHRDQCPYHWGGYSDIDMAADELGLWVIWGRQPESCAFAISKIDHETDTITQSWFPPSGISFNKNGYGNAFMKCGNMYVMNHHHHTNTWVRWIYFTRNSSYVEVPESDPNRIILQNNNIYNSYLDYNPRDKKLYSWENAYRNRYLVHEQ